MTDVPKILVVDDEIGICEGIRRALTPLGFTVDTALNGMEGMRKVEADGFDLVLVDVMMPGIGGIELIASIRKHDPEIVCVIITGYATVELAVRAIKQGAYDFLTKPFTIDELTLAVNQALERRRLSLEARRLQEIEAEAKGLAEEKARLEELDKAKRQFIRLVTHELQRPIAAIDNYLALIQEGYLPPEELRSVIEKSRARAEEQMQLISDLLEFGQLQVLSSPPRNEPVQLDRVLIKVLETIQPQAAEKNIELRMQICPDVPLVMGLPARFKSVWANLIGNAIKYTPPGGRVDVRLREEDGRVIGEVSDSGIGIPAEDQRRVFTEFFRAANAKALEVPGTGLGLAIAKKIIDDAGGEITFDSAPGRGTCFTFSIKCR